jgi:hypothetical protein
VIPPFKKNLNVELPGSGILPVWDTQSKIQTRHLLNNGVTQYFLMTSLLLASLSITMRAQSSGCGISLPTWCNSVFSHLTSPQKLKTILIY